MVLARSRVWPGTRTRVRVRVRPRVRVRDEG